MRINYLIFNVKIFFCYISILQNNKMNIKDLLKDIRHIKKFIKIQ